MPLSVALPKIELISGMARQRRFTTGQKLAMVAKAMQAGMSMS